jgi:hypothetical protein
MGRYIMGGTRDVNDEVSIFVEKTYDAFGRYRALTSAYGLTDTPTDAFSSSVAVEFGQLEEDAAIDFDRSAISVGAQYQTEALNLGGRLEYRIEEGTRSGNALEAETIIASADARYKISDAAGVVFALDGATTDASDSFLDGDYAEVQLGYAYRPVDNDRLNVLARHRYVYDIYGQRTDGTDEDGPRQRSHVFSVDGSYDIDTNWTLGGKIGYRFAETSPDRASAFSENHAYLAVVLARYHLVHNWDALLEVRNFTTVQAGTYGTSAVGTLYRHFGNNV